MQGPFHYIERKLFKSNILDEVLGSEDKHEIRASRAVGALMVATFATLTTYAAIEAVDHVKSASRSHDTVIMGAESFGAAGDAAAGVAAGGIAIEMAAFVISSTRRIREIE